MGRLTVILCLIGVIIPFVYSMSEPQCQDKQGSWRRVWEEWKEGKEFCVCNYPERYLPDPPPFSEFSPPEPQCRLMGCEDRYTGEFQRPGGFMFNEAFNVMCKCVAGNDPDASDQGLPDLYHWDC